MFNQMLINRNRNGSNESFMHLVNSRIIYLYGSLKNTVFYTNETESILYSTLPQHSTLLHSKVCWIYKTHMDLREIDLELRSQYEEYHHHISKGILTVVSHGFIGYKKVFGYNSKLGYNYVVNEYVLPLWIPKGACMYKSIWGIHEGKCRTSHAYSYYTNPTPKKIEYRSIFDNDFKYPDDFGILIQPENYPFDDFLDESCSSGIHFFMTYEEALKFNT